MVTETKTVEMSYEKYGKLIFNGDIKVMSWDYSKGYTIVSDEHGIMWKVTYDKNKNVAVFTKVDE